MPAKSSTSTTNKKAAPPSVSKQPLPPRCVPESPVSVATNATQTTTDKAAPAAPLLVPINKRDADGDISELTPVTDDEDDETQNNTDEALLEQARKAGLPTSKTVRCAECGKPVALTWSGEGKPITVCLGTMAEDPSCYWQRPGHAKE